MFLKMSWSNGKCILWCETGWFLLWSGTDSGHCSMTRKFCINKGSDTRYVLLTGGSGAKNSTQLVDWGKKGRYLYFWMGDTFWKGTMNRRTGRRYERSCICKINYCNLKENLLISSEICVKMELVFIICWKWNDNILVNPQKREEVMDNEVDSGHYCHHAFGSVFMYLIGV